jgi:hypothetical protein
VDCLWEGDEKLSPKRLIPRNYVAISNINRFLIYLPFLRLCGKVKQSEGREMVQVRIQYHNTLNF